MKAIAALDLSGPRAALAVLDENGNVLCDSTVPMRGRTSAELTPWILRELVGCGVSETDVKRWTIGAGPGSFTGMRLAAALITGMVYGRDDAKLRCVPTALAFAARSYSGNAEEGAHCAILFDGRNREMLLFDAVYQNGEWVPAGRELVMNANDAEAFFEETTFDQILAPDFDCPALAKLLTVERMKTVCPADTISAVPLATARYKEFDNNSAALVYIRPAVFTNPA